MWPEIATLRQWYMNAVSNQSVKRYQAPRHQPPMISEAFLCSNCAPTSSKDEIDLLIWTVRSSSGYSVVLKPKGRIPCFKGFGPTC